MVKNEVEKILSISRDKIAKELNLIDENQHVFVGFGLLNV